MDLSIEKQLAALFRETKVAHQNAFAATIGGDPDWPAWYAEYLAPRLRELLGLRFDPEALAAELKALDAEHGRLAPQEPWPEFYARTFLRRQSR